MNPTLKNPARDPARLRELNERAVILQRLRDYELQPTDRLREMLVDRWKAEHPAAALERSGVFHPLERHAEVTKQREEDPDEAWYNDVYYVTVRRKLPDKMFGTKQGMTTLGIASHDGTARHDWRDFQAMKNQIAGAECEGVELYPAESRLLDPSNYYTIWCFPGLKRLHIGRGYRDVRGANAQALAPQRAFAEEER